MFIGLTYPGGRALHYARNEIDTVISIQNLAHGAEYPGSNALPDTYNIAMFEYQGRLCSQSHLGNGAVSSLQYDRAGRWIEIHHQGAAQALLKLQHLFDAAGNMR